MAAPGSFRNVCPGPRATPSATNLPSVPGKDGLDRAALVGVGWEYMVAFAAVNGTRPTTSGSAIWPSPRSSPTPWRTST
jgi:hypothetical protein